MGADVMERHGKFFAYMMWQAVVWGHTPFAEQLLDFEADIVSLLSGDNLSTASSRVTQFMRNMGVTRITEWSCPV